MYVTRVNPIPFRIRLNLREQSTDIRDRDPDIRPPRGRDCVQTRRQSDAKVRGVCGFGVCHGCFGR